MVYLVPLVPAQVLRFHEPSIKITNQQTFLLGFGSGCGFEPGTMRSKASVEESMVSSWVGLSIDPVDKALALPRGTIVSGTSAFVWVELSCSLLVDARCKGFYMHMNTERT